MKTRSIGKYQSGVRRSGVAAFITRTMTDERGERMRERSETS